MALIKCPECGKEIDDSTEICTHCGHSIKQLPVNSQENKKPPKGETVTLIGWLLMLTMLAPIIDIILGDKGSLNFGVGMEYHTDPSKMGIYITVFIIGLIITVVGAVISDRTIKHKKGGEES